MPILLWKEELSVGVKKIDEEHKRLIAMINKAYDSVASMTEREVLEELILEMRQYAMSHFAMEEMLMKHYRYPDFQSHRMEHNKFMIYASSTDNVRGMDSEAIEPIKVFKYLADWLREHILVTDKRLGAYLQSQGSLPGV